VNLFPPAHRRRNVVAFDSRRMPDPSQLLEPATAAAIKKGFVAQLSAGAVDPLPELIEAIRRAGAEAKARKLLPEALIIQLKALADEAGLPHPDSSASSRQSVRQWMVAATLKAYWA
jgi:hypothetical protein